MTLLKQNNSRSAIQDTLIMAKRDLLLIRHSLDKLMDVTVMPVILMVLFTELFGGALAGSTTHYLLLVVPGIIIQSLLNAATATGTQLREDIDTGVFDRFKSLPIARMAPLAGLILSDVVRYAADISVAIVTGLILGWRVSAGWVWLLAASGLAIFTAWALSWLFALIGLVLKSTTAVSSISMTLALVLSFLSSAFVAIKTMPRFLQPIASANPVTHMVAAFRLMVNQGRFGVDAVAVLAGSIVIVAVFAPLTVHLYAKLA